MEEKTNGGARRILKITHNAGFFSCCSIKLEEIILFFNETKRVPEKVDGSEQFSAYKSESPDDLTPLYFTETPADIPYGGHVRFRNEYQFFDYQELNFKSLRPFIQKYFSPSAHVKSIVSLYEKKYAIRHELTCGVFYRGNDKSTETPTGTYETFISEAAKIKKRNPRLRFLVQTDEAGFLSAFKKAFPDSFHLEEIPRIDNKSSVVHKEIPVEDRAEFAASFLAATLILSKCEYLITHSGNCGLWAVLYRGNGRNVLQFLDSKWKRSKIERFFMWMKIEYWRWRNA